MLQILVDSNSDTLGPDDILIFGDSWSSRTMQIQINWLQVTSSLIQIILEHGNKEMDTYQYFIFISHYFNKKIAIVENLKLSITFQRKCSLDLTLYFNWNMYCTLHASSQNTGTTDCSPITHQKYILCKQNIIEVKIARRICPENCAFYDKCKNLYVVRKHYIRSHLKTRSVTNLNLKFVKLMNAASLNEKLREHFH